MSLSEDILKITTDFVGKDLVQTESITLSEKDWEIVTSAIKDPPELNSALKTAINRYKKDKLEKFMKNG
ncbi:MAG: DUF1778 domain-containing protein [Hormoscilla sp. GM7CHS1pb]|nr:DUF1778 domain-containing protein [Hormoscilla sp. GM7CHS1pb]